jgi:hypothetical protein
MDKRSFSERDICTKFRSPSGAFPFWLRRGGPERTSSAVHVHQGGKAIVGHVSTNGRGKGGFDGNGRQPQGLDAPALAHAPGASVWSLDPKGDACQSPAVRGKKRCRMHGGAKGSGAPSGERNGNYLHGRRTKQHMAEMRLARAILAQARSMLSNL